MCSILKKCVSFFIEMYKRSKTYGGGEGRCVLDHWKGESVIHLLICISKTINVYITLLNK